MDLGEAPRGYLISHLDCYRAEGAYIHIYKRYMHYIYIYTYIYSVCWICPSTKLLLSSHSAKWHDMTSLVSRFQRMILRPQTFAGLDASGHVSAGRSLYHPATLMQKNTAHQKEESHVLKKESMPNVADQNHMKKPTWEGSGMNLRKLEVSFRSI